jgi:hypothetical protein
VLSYLGLKIADINAGLIDMSLECLFGAFRGLVCGLKNFEDLARLSLHLLERYAIVGTDI